MLPDRVSNPGPLTYESGALRGPAITRLYLQYKIIGDINFLLHSSLLEVTNNLTVHVSPDCSAATAAVTKSLLTSGNCHC